MKDIEKVKILTELALYGEQNPSTFYDDLEKIGVLKCNYYDYMITEPIDCEEELKRLPEADYDVTCALMTMLLREDHFSNGSFERRYQNGQVVPILERMIQLLQPKCDDKIKSATIKSVTGYVSPDLVCEQQITISSTGRVYYKSSRPYLQEDTNDTTIKKQIFIGKDKSKEILNAIYEYYIDSHIYCIVMDGGDFDLTMKFENGDKINFNNSIAYEKGSKENILSDFIRERVPIDNMMLFDGFDDELEDED